jgi:hypothetical protein
VFIFLGQCAFGMDTDMQNDIDNIFLRKAQASIDENPEKYFLIKLGNLMPFLIPILSYILIGQMLLFHLFRKVAPEWFLPQIEEFPPFWMLNQVESVINARTTSNSNKKQNRVDLLQLMLDASTHDDIKVRIFSQIDTNNYKVEVRSSVCSIPKHILAFLSSFFCSISLDNLRLEKLNTELHEKI